MNEVPHKTTAAGKKGLTKVKETVTIGVVTMTTKIEVNAGQNITVVCTIDTDGLVVVLRRISTAVEHIPNWTVISLGMLTMIKNVLTNMFTTTINVLTKTTNVLTKMTSMLTKITSMLTKTTTVLTKITSELTKMTNMLTKMTVVLTNMLTKMTVTMEIDTVVTLAAASSMVTLIDL